MGHKSMYDVDKDSYPGKSEELDQRAVYAMSTTWDRIADDCFFDDCGQSDESKTMRRSEVLELVLDADRMATEDADAARYTIWLSRFNKAHFDRVVKMAFPYKTYGY